MWALQASQHVGFGESQDLNLNHQHPLRFRCTLADSISNPALTPRCMDYIPTSFDPFHSHLSGDQGAECQAQYMLKRSSWRRCGISNSPAYFLRRSAYGYRGPTYFKPGQSWKLIPQYQLKLFNLTALHEQRSRLA